MRSMVEGARFERIARSWLAPSTALRAVPVPVPGRI